MNNATYPLTAAMINQFNRIDMISNNLANANTNGFKQEGLSEGSFNNYLKKAEEGKLNATRLGTVLNTIPKIDQKYVDSSQGVITPTSNNMDFALKNQNTFFQVENDNGDVLLTRDGSFHILDNVVVNSVGQKVLSADGAQIEAEPGFEGLISVVKTDYNNLEKIGNNNYKIKNENDVEVILDPDEEILQGAIEKSNVNSVHSMVALIDAQRRFEQAQKAIQGKGEMSKSLIEKLGRNT